MNSIDIIIPVLNEEEILIKEARYYQTLKNRARVIFVDGGSTDRTVAIAQGYGEVISCATGRAIQKNRGAQETQADYLLFLHVDALIDEHALDSIDQILKKGSIGGCLTMHIDDGGFIFRIYEWAVNFRARVFGIIDGDLGTFVRRDIFDQLGGFDSLPVMEDLLFGKKLCKIGPISVLPESIYVSSRKWHERGFVRTFLDYTLAHIQLWTGYLKIKSVKKKSFTAKGHGLHANGRGFSS